VCFNNDCFDYYYYYIIDALFLINVSKNKINYWFIMDTVCLRVPTKGIEEFSTFNVSNALQQGVSQLQTASADLWTFPINILSP
jgi:hypothetical protein